MLPSYYGKKQEILNNHIISSYVKFFTLFLLFFFIVLKLSLSTIIDFSPVSEASCMLDLFVFVSELRRNLNLSYPPQIQLRAK